MNELVCLWLPCDDDEEVQSVPGVGEVSLVTDEPHGCDLDQHLDGEEDEDGVIERLEDAAARGDTRNVVARLKHAQRHAVE